MKHDLDIFFRDYADLFNRALSGQLVLDEIRAVFTDAFIAAGPKGVVCGANDDALTARLEKSYDFYRKIGAKRLAVREVQPTEIDEAHVMSRVAWTGDYEKPDGEVVRVDFDVTYLLQTSGQRPLIFAYVAGDEMALFRERGLLPEDMPEYQAA